MHRLVSVVYSLVITVHALTVPIHVSPDKRKQHIYTLHLAYSYYKEAHPPLLNICRKIHNVRHNHL